MLVWLNGPFGVGKSTTAERMAALRPRCRHYDAESVGSMLRANLTGVRIGDFQHLAAWRRLVPEVARDITELTGDQLVMVQSVLVQDYRTELVAGLRAAGFSVLNVLLDIEPDQLHQRIDDDQAFRRAVALGTLEPGAIQWRHDHVAAYTSERDALRSQSDVVLDAGRLDASAVTAAVLERLPSDWGLDPAEPIP